jgi:hypothetical protein
MSKAVKQLPEMGAAAEVTELKWLTKASAGIIAELIRD